MIAEEIEDPFGTDVNDLPVDSIANKIKNNIEEIFAAWRGIDGALHSGSSFRRMTKVI